MTGLSLSRCHDRRSGGGADDPASSQHVLGSDPALYTPLGDFTDNTIWRGQYGEGTQSAEYFGITWLTSRTGRL